MPNFMKVIMLNPIKRSVFYFIIFNQKKNSSKHFRGLVLSVNFRHSMNKNLKKKIFLNYCQIQNNYKNVLKFKTLKSYYSNLKKFFF